MKCHFDIDYKKRTLSIEKLIQKKSLDLIRNRIELDTIKQNIEIFKTVRKYYCIEKKGLIKIIVIYLYPELSFLDEWIPNEGQYFLN